DELRLELSEQVRKGKLAGFLEIGPDACVRADKARKELSEIRYQSNRPTRLQFPQLVEPALMERIQQLRSKKADLTFETVKAVTAPVQVAIKMLSKRDPATGEIVDGTEIDRIAPIAVPLGLMMLMFMVMMMTATPLMQGVVEEKMQRIAEVLLGSVQPFSL